MCIAVHLHSLGAADALLDLTLGLLILRPSLTLTDRVTAARRILELRDVPQPDDESAVACVCGLPLRVDHAHDGHNASHVGGPFGVTA